MNLYANKITVANENLYSDGILSDRLGTTIIKPCKRAEINFYESAIAHPEFNDFIPKFVGKISLASDADVALAAAAIKQSSSADQHNSALPIIPDAVATDTAWAPSGGGKIATDSAIVLDNVAVHYRKPNILDVKLGARLWADDSPPAKREKMDKQAMETTSKGLGIRIAGMRNWQGLEFNGRPEVNFDGYRVFDKYYGRSLTSETVHHGFENFFNMVDGRIPNKNTRRVIQRFVDDLEGLQSVIEAEESRIYSSSLLFVYEGDEVALQEAFHIEKMLLATYKDVSNELALDRHTSNEKDQMNGQTLTILDTALLSRTPLVNGSQPSSENLPPECDATQSNSTSPLNSALPLNVHVPLNGGSPSNSTVSRHTDATSRSPLLNTNSSGPLLIESSSPSSTSVSASDHDDNIHFPPIQALKLIDFAHAQWTPGQGADENLLHGIRNVIKILRGLLRVSD